jgi:hypothetical protein
MGMPGTSPAQSRAEAEVDVPLHARRTLTAHEVAHNAAHSRALQLGHESALERATAVNAGGAQARHNMCGTGREYELREEMHHLLAARRERQSRQLSGASASALPSPTSLEPTSEIARFHGVEHRDELISLQARMRAMQSAFVDSICQLDAMHGQVESMLLPPSHIQTTAPMVPSGSMPRGVTESSGPLASSAARSAIYPGDLTAAEHVAESSAATPATYPGDLTAAEHVAESSAATPATYPGPATAAEHVAGSSAGAASALSSAEKDADVVRQRRLAFLQRLGQQPPVDEAGNADH